MWRQLLPPMSRGGTPLQAQLRAALVGAMLDGRLAPGTRMPASRELSTMLGLSRNTVVIVYEKLTDDGYLEARSRTGYFVSGRIERPRPQSIAARLADATPDWGQRGDIHDGHGNNGDAAMRWLDRAAGWRKLPYPFVLGQFDSKLFPLADWRECTRLSLEVAAVAEWGQDNGDPESGPLVDQLIRRVLPRRGIAAKPDEVLVTMGTQHGLYLLAELFMRRGTRVAVEDPGYMDARNIFQRRGAHVAPRAVDENGVTVGDPDEACDYLYCTPSHQCPSGVTMSTDRRLALLDDAGRRDYVIIEDDYDPETQYVGQPLPALKAIDKCDRVIYLSSLSKLLSPGLRIGYIVAPREVVAALKTLRRLMIRNPPGNNPAATALFIQHGYYDRLMHEVRGVLAQRATVLAAALARHLPSFDFQMPHGGSVIWGTIAEQIEMEAFHRESFQAGVICDDGKPFFADPAHAGRHLRFGFSSIPQERIEPGIRAVAAVVASLSRSRKR
jgi:GntR family transcriptional regulator/MocR family aminotransferase